MTITEVPEHGWIREAVPAASSRLVRVLDRAVESAELAISDVHSLNDFLGAVPPARADNLGLLLVPLFLALEEGSLAIDLDPAALGRRLQELVPDDEAADWIEAAVRDIRSGAFAAVVAMVRTNTVPVNVPLVLWERGERRHLYFQKYFRAERDFDCQLRLRLERAASSLDMTRLREAVADVLVRRPVRGARGPIAPDADQRTALGLALLRHLVLISGGPGTGKTFLVLNVLRALVRLGIAADRIALAAPTGRAAQRLSDALRAGLATLGPDALEADRALAQVAPVTLHRLLDYQPQRNLFRRHEENPIPADVVLVDEVSMVSIEQMARLLRALEPGTRLIFLGDKDQLPSVEAGAVLGQLVGDLPAPSFSETTRTDLHELFPDLDLTPGPNHWLRDAVVFLRTNHRSHPQIQDAARAVNRQDATLLDRLSTLPPPGDPTLWQRPTSDGGCWWWEQKHANAAELRQMLHRWAENSYLTPLADGMSFLQLLDRPAPAADQLDDPDVKAWLVRLFAALDRTRLLTLVREGPWGCEQINRYLADWLRHHRERFRHHDLVPGTPLLITRNDRARGLANGDVGLVLANRQSDPTVVFASQDRFVAFAPETLPAHELGFALTVHKSQGSEYDQVLLMVPPQGGRRLLTKELLYTAITRAKQLAILCATPDAFRAALARRIVRESGL